MPSKLLSFSILLLANLGLLNGEYTVSENVVEYVLQSSQLKSGTEDVKNNTSFPQRLVFKWTGHAVGYSNPSTLVPSYVASVSYGPHSSSLIYTCFLTTLLPVYAQNQTGFVHGANGYSCKITKGKPGSLTEPVDTTQKPAVSNTTVPETQPTSPGPFPGSAGSENVSNENSVPNPMVQQRGSIKTRTARYF
ncbi:uncharacterized protein LOC106674363 [Cimex lectularius]|uniref:Uncharacterized protein n=1 Tax=Cimex lectularius TaxID=79782 RepID=A0A8I6SDL5_CIMLE|nr:uncharacterized protein LOC106674363 [Cimex lectularius]